MRISTTRGSDLIRCLALCLAGSACGDDGPASSGGAGPASSSSDAATSTASSAESASGSQAAGTGGRNGNGGGSSEAGGGGAASVGGSGGGDGGGAGGDEPIETDLVTLEGDIVSSLDFDALAEKRGFVDCTFTRHYVGIEDASAPWLCPSCELMVRAEVEVTDGLDCFEQILLLDPDGIEWLGIADGLFLRSGGGPLSGFGPALEDGATFTAEASADALPVVDGGSFDVVSTASFERGEEVGDRLNGFRPPETYACGWPRADVPPYTGDYRLAQGEQMPDGIFRDACDEPVRLHHLAGSYLLLTMGAADCPPCELLAELEEDFASEMSAEGIDVRVVTLLAPSLGDTVSSPDADLLATWTEHFEIETGVVLGDRGWGLSVFLFEFPDPGYPSWLLVDPDLTVFAFGQGVQSFDTWGDMIRAHDDAL